MRRYQSSQGDNASISVSGNARAILGDVYRFCEHPDNDLPSPIETPVSRLKTSQYQIFEEESRSPEQFGKVVVALLSDYRNLKVTIQTYRGLHRKIQRCASHISIRQGVCEQSLRNLLVLFTRSSQDANEMLASDSHLVWTRSDFLEYLQDCSATATEALWETLGSLISDLETLDSFAQGCTTLYTAERAVSFETALVACPSHAGTSSGEFSSFMTADTDISRNTTELMIRYDRRSNQVSNNCCAGANSTQP